MAYLFLDLASASDWLIRLLQATRSTSQIRVVTRHKYGISVLIHSGFVQVMENLGLRTADAFPFVASLPPKLFFGAREATTGNVSALHRLGKPRKSWNLRISYSRPGKSWNLIAGP